MPASTPTRAIDRLRKAANLEPTKKNVELSDGSTFEMWVSPLTMAERERAQKQAKSEDANAFALQLLISKALDENGSQAVRSLAKSTYSRTKSRTRISRP
jgi:cell division inhibitor SulA